MTKIRTKTAFGRKKRYTKLRGRHAKRETEPEAETEVLFLIYSHNRHKEKQ